MSYPQDEREILATNINMPRDYESFDDWFQDLYLDMSRSINSRILNYFPMAITDTAQDIRNLPNYGSFLIMVSGIDDTLPCLSATLNKSSSSLAGAIANLGNQAGSAGGAWAGNVLTITSTTTNFQIRHNRAGVTGNFNVQIIGTQG